MGTTIKTLSLAFAATLGAALVYVLTFVSPRSPALKNQKEVVRLLYEARPTLAPTDTNEYAVEDPTGRHRLECFSPTALSPQYGIQHAYWVARDSPVDGDSGGCG